MDPTSGILTINMALGAFATILLGLSATVLKVIWSEVKNLRGESRDHALLLRDHDGQLENHAEDIRVLKERIFHGGHA